MTLQARRRPPFRLILTAAAALLACGWWTVQTIVAADNSAGIVDSFYREYDRKEFGRSPELGLEKQYAALGRAVSWSPGFCWILDPFGERVRYSVRVRYEKGPSTDVLVLARTHEGYGAWSVESRTASALR